MAQVAFEKNIGSEWVDVTTLATLTEDEVYYIQNRGAGVLLAQENNAEPTDESGTVVKPYKVLKYTNNGKLWVKSLSGLCTINITDKNAPEPTKKTVWFPIETLDGFSEEVIEEEPYFKYSVNAIGEDGEDTYDIYFEQTLNPVAFQNVSVTKDGTTTSANMYMRILSDAEPIDKQTSELTITTSDNWTFEWSSTDGYAGTFTIEADPDTEVGYRYVGGEVTKDNEVIGYGELFVKAEV